MIHPCCDTDSTHGCDFGGDDFSPPKKNKKQKQKQNKTLQIAFRRAILTPNLVDHPLCLNNTVSILQKQISHGEELRAAGKTGCDANLEWRQLLSH